MIHILAKRAGSEGEGLQFGHLEKVVSSKPSLKVGTSDLEMAETRTISVSDDFEEVSTCDETTRTVHPHLQTCQRRKIDLPHEMQDGVVR
jgi:hypothetical protein